MATSRTTPLKKVLIFYPRMSQLARSVKFANRSNKLLRLYESQLVRYTFSKIRTTLSFYVDVLQDFFLQRTAKKCTRIHNARAEPLFYSLNISFGDPPIAPAVLVC